MEEILASLLANPVGALGALGLGAVIEPYTQRERLIVVNVVLGSVISR